MTTFIKPAFVALTLALAAAGAFAQGTSGAASTPRIDKREANQDARIQQGVKSGQLNAKETYRLEKQQGRIETAQANAKADGKVTKAERRKLTHMQDRASKNIHKQKHDAQTAQPTAKP